MSQVAIKVENLGKKYVIKHKTEDSYRTFQDLLIQRSKSLVSSIIPYRKNSLAGTSEEEFWALNDLDFEIKQGDKVGIIGGNGAGKSTLLKVLSRITEPTTGSIHLNGRIASLLEVGTGFHPELTGRENIFLNGAILGMTRNDIKNKFDEIVAFAEVEHFLDTPVKRYSSGMYVRLAFSVSAHLEPEILIVDEVLAVGDAKFQKKCLGKMKSVGDEGRTVLFVSHNTAAIKTLCNRGIVLDKGQMLFQGNIEDAVEQYLDPSMLAKNEVSWEIDSPENENIKLNAIKVKPLNGLVIDIDSGIKIITTFDNKVEGKNLDFTLRMFTFDEIYLFESGVVLSKEGDVKVGEISVAVEIPPHLLNAGIYKINIVFGDSQKYTLFAIENVISFEVEHTTTGRGNNMSVAPGVIRPLLNWSFDFSHIR